MVVGGKDPTTSGGNAIRPVEAAAGGVPVELSWVVAVGILGTAAEWLALLARSLPLPDSADLYPDIRTAHFYLDEVFGDAATALGWCRRWEQRFVLAEAAMSVFAAWLVECGVTQPAPGQAARRLVRRRAVKQSLWTVIRELRAVAGVQRLRGLADELSEDRLGALLGAEIVSGTRVSGGVLALLDYAQSTAAAAESSPARRVVDHDQVAAADAGDGAGHGSVDFGLGHGLGQGF
jgi:hypothetical protein